MKFLWEISGVSRNFFYNQCNELRAFQVSQIVWLTDDANKIQIEKPIDLSSFIFNFSKAINNYES